MVTKRKKSVHNNIKTGWKTTILGVIIILATLASIFLVPGITWWPEGFVGIAIGVVLWFVPDTFINLITNFIGGTRTTVISRTGKTNPMDDITDVNNIPPDQLIEP